MKPANAATSSNTSIQAGTRDPHSRQTLKPRRHLQVNADGAVALLSRTFAQHAKQDFVPFIAKLSCGCEVGNSATMADA